MDIFRDYGFKTIVKHIRKKVEELGIQVKRNNSIIKQKFLTFPENQMFNDIIDEYYDWLKDIDTKQE